MDVFDGMDRGGYDAVFSSVESELKRALLLDAGIVAAVPDIKEKPSPRLGPVLLSGHKTRYWDLAGWCSKCGLRRPFGGPQSKTCQVCAGLATDTASSRERPPSFAECYMEFKRRQMEELEATYKSGFPYVQRGASTSYMGLRRHLPELIAEQNGECGICGGPLPDDIQAGQIEVDHIVPRAAGGGDEIENLQAAHGYCNRVKGNRAD